MERFVRLTAVAVPLEGTNIDTDRIVPGRFLRKPRTHGYGDFLFHDLRAEPDFPLNQPAWTDAAILVADANFGCGSSREGAVWALVDHGFRVVIAPSFGDIFATNCVKNGLLAVRLPTASLRAHLRADPGATVTVDLEAQTVSDAGGVRSFTMDPFQRRCLLDGTDDIAVTLRHAEALERFEREHLGRVPWVVSYDGRGPQENR